MKRQLLIVGLGLMGLVNGCSPVSSSSGNQNPDIVRADEMYNSGVSKILNVHVKNTEYPIGYSKRFYDLDGDGKTVEQYVELYEIVNAPFGISEVSKNLIRPGANPEFNPQFGNYREMTSEEMQKLDLIYQSLISRD